jgi:hypothetical protein
MHQTKSVFWIILTVSLLALVPHLFIPIVNYGQLDKQTFAAEMIRSFVNGNVVHHLFAIRHFLESNHDGLIPWAEEFPLYNWVVMLLTSITGVNSIIVAKLTSFCALPAIAYSFFKIAKQVTIDRDSMTPYLFAATAFLFPAFRLYSIEVMPDLWMTAFCVFAIERATADRPKTSAFMIAIASLLKYYAVFTGFGIGLYYLYRWIKEKHGADFANAFYFAIAIIPCFAYIAYFIHLQIPNPITEYRANDGHGHLSSLHGVHELKKWGRVFLWVFVKNSTLLGSALAAFGVYHYRKSLHPLLVTLSIGWFLFPLVFIESFYVHDYYGLQASIGVAIFAALGLNALRKNPKQVFALLYIFAIWSVVQVRGMNRPLQDFAQIEKDYPALVEKADLKPEWGFMISGISKPVVPFILHLNAWTANFEELSQPITQKRMLDLRIDILMIHNFLSQEGDTERAISEVKKTGQYALISDQKYTESRLVTFKRIR